MSVMFEARPVKFQPSWFYGMLLSLIQHLILLLLLFYTFTDNTPLLAPPAAVMLEFAPQVQVAVTRPEVPVGVDQQQKVDAATAQVTPEKVETHQVVEADNAELEKQKPQKLPRKPAKKQHVQRQNRTSQQPVDGNARITSQAAPLPQQKVATKTAAPVESDASKLTQQRITWEGLVLGILNRVKQYPDDAKRRGREGVVRVRFIVNASGEVIARQLVDSSGTLSLDREALAMLQRAQPLPPPPAELLESGRYAITLPVDFALKK